jgi:hexosaminidase
MKYVIVLIFAVCVSCNVSKKNEAGITIIPKPESLSVTGGLLKLNNRATIYCSEENSAAVINTFSDEVKDHLYLEPGKKEGSDIEILIEPGKKPEAYSLHVNKEKITISASTLNGAFYGMQSLRQLIIYSEKKNEKLLIPCCTVEDTPRYSWRGIMLDESRHFFGIEKVKQLLDVMALHKLNIFHWHMTDCSGWRLEIKKYPKLTTVGGIGNNNEPDAPAMFYTQDQIKEIVKYAADRFIQVVPEIDMPGHAAASNRAYPEFSGGGSKEYPEFTFNPGKEGTYDYLTNILIEVKTLFPSTYLHLGGDEVNFGNQQWNTDKHVRSLMKKYNLADLKAVEKYFVKRMADTIKSLNRTTVGWDEIIDLKLDPRDAIVMWWRHDKPAQLDSALTRNYRVVLCPRIPLYFDFVQYTTHKWGRRWRKAFCELETVYNFPPDSLFRIKEPDNLVMGMQANLWTEVIQNNKRLDFMTYPRLSAMAEAAWTNNGNKDYNGFLIRLKPLLNYLKEKNIYYFDPFEPELNPEPAGPGK